MQKNRRRKREEKYQKTNGRMNKKKTKKKITKRNRQVKKKMRHTYTRKLAENEHTAALLLAGHVLERHQIHTVAQRRNQRTIRTEGVCKKGKGECMNKMKIKKKKKMLLII